MALGGWKKFGSYAFSQHLVWICYKVKLQTLYQQKIGLLAPMLICIWFLIILFFHNRIFKVADPVTPVDSTQVSPPVDGEYPIEPDKIVLEENSIQSGDEVNNNSDVNNKSINNFNNSLSESIQIEDTTENAGTGPGGPIENKNW